MLFKKSSKKGKKGREIIKKKKCRYTRTATEKREITSPTLRRHLFLGVLHWAEAAKWAADCETLNECSAVLIVVWSINKGSDWVISVSTMVYLTVNLLGSTLKRAFQSNSKYPQRCELSPPKLTANNWLRCSCKGGTLIHILWWSGVTTVYRMHVHV